MDAIVSECVITLDPRWENDLPGAVEAHKVHDLQKLDCVEYVRTVFTYHANYPPGHPKDKDGR